MANTKGSDNPFPSVLFEEHVDPSDPASGFQRLFVDTDHLLKLRDSAGTVTTFAAGFADPMTTRGDIIIRDASNVTARLGRGSAGYVLTSDGTDVAWAAAAGGYIGTLTEATLTSDVTMTTAGTFYDGPTTTPTAGVYDVWARVVCAASGANENGVVGRLIANGSSTPIDEAQEQHVMANTSQMNVILSARVTADGSNPILVRATMLQNSGTMKRDPGSSSSGIHRGTLLRLVRVS